MDKGVVWYRFKRYKWSRRLDKFGNYYVHVWWNLGGLFGPWHSPYVAVNSRKGYADVMSIIEDNHGRNIHANLIDSYVPDEAGVGFL